MSFQDKETLVIDRRWNVDDRLRIGDVRDVVALVDKHLEGRRKFRERKLLAKLGRESLFVKFGEILFLDRLVESEEGVEDERSEFFLRRQLGSLGLENEREQQKRQ